MNRNNGLLVLVVFSVAFSRSSLADSINLAASPLYIGSDVPPLVMIDISKDHQLFYKAYNDYSDIDNDHQIETTYKHSIDYYGYFDSYKCYSYSSKMFSPSSFTADKYCTGSWSGNFLNWITTSRMDAVRKLLYGGYRSIDKSTQTVLERAFIPMDAHAWAKYYNGNDINKLTPFDGLSTTPPSFSAITSSNVSLPTINSSYSDISFTFSAAPADVKLGDQISIAITATPTNKVIGSVLDITNSGKTIKLRIYPQGVFGTGSAKDWTITNQSATGISFCNTTAKDSTQFSDTNTNPPLMRVVKGNYSLWNSNERWQCNWFDEKNNTQSSFGGIRSNGNSVVLSGLPSSAENPKQSTNGLGTVEAGEYIVRTEVCKASLINQTINGKIVGETCKLYPNGNYKPIGLLQTYGDNGQIKFGLFTGSYTKNKSGGVLRQNTISMNEEINVDTDGTLKTLSIGSGIIHSLDAIRIYGYDYNDGYYNTSAKDNCPWQMTSLTEGNCTSWGNPIAEIYLESLRYFAGKSATSNFLVSGADKLAGLKNVAWIDPINSKNYCAPLNILTFNASVSSYDNDQMTNDLGFDSAEQTNLIGGWEGISGKNWFIGNNGSLNDGYCSAKIVSTLATANGLCPEAPTLAGSYLDVGAAYWAHTNRIRTDLTVPATDKKSLKVDSYGIALATSVPKIDIKIPGTANYVSILPAYRLNLSTGYGIGTLVDFKVISQSANATTASGKFYVNFEDSQQGGDYDEDVWGTIAYMINTATNTITVTTDTIAQSSTNPQFFGYVISGTTKDGVHFHSGVYGDGKLSYNDSKNVAVTSGDPPNNLNGGNIINASGGCIKCTVDDPPTSVTYTLGTTTDNLLKDPLWYLAKWGGFKDLNENNQLDLNDTKFGSAEWDARNNTTGIAGSDGVPDNYFYVVNPGDLEKSLNKAFTQILESSSAASVATNSTTLRSGSRVYQARFNSKLWSGQLLSFKLDESANVIEPPEWDAGVIINTQSSDSNDQRRIITYSRDLKDGIPFQWSDINGLTDKTQATALNTNGVGVADGKGKERLEYLRGWKTNEGLSATNFRQRNISILGDIVNSNPWYVGAPQAGFPDPAYLKFRIDNLKRKPVIYVGANDGMLHGFDASTDPVTDKPISGTGKELIAYVPGKVYPNLSKLTEVNYSHHYFVDGSPMVADADVGGWKTILVGGLNAGGQGYYALDITNPANFTESNASGLVMWEFTDEDDPDLGYTFNQPIARDNQSPDSGQIMKMANGKWAVIIGNGYNNTEADDNGGCTDSPDVKPCTVSTTGHAMLYILFLEGPTGTNHKWIEKTDFIKIDTGAGTVAAPNGLATPRPIDSDGDGDVDYIYAGDLQGNLWKFDVSGITTTDWKVALSGLPLFTAKDEDGNPQPITTSPTVTPHPYGGFMVSFGTGKYLEVNDVDSATVPYKTQTLYGLWDKPDDKARSIKADRSTLVEQTIIQTTTINGDSYRIASKNEIIWEATPTEEAKDGWYMNLPDSKTTGERVAYNPILRFGRFVATTLIPLTSPCESGGHSWLMEVDYLSGGRRNSSPFDVNKDNKIDSADLQTITVTGSDGKVTKVSVAVSGTDTGIGITPTATVIKGKGDEFKVLSGSSGKVKTIREEGGDSGRLNWREIIND